MQTNLKFEQQTNKNENGSRTWSPAGTGPARVQPRAHGLLRPERARVPPRAHCLLRPERARVPPRAQGLVRSELARVRPRAHGLLRPERALVRRRAQGRVRPELARVRPARACSCRGRALSNSNTKQTKMKTGHAPGTSVAATDEAGRLDAEAGIAGLRKMGRAKNNEDRRRFYRPADCCVLRVVCAAR